MLHIDLKLAPGENLERKPGPPVQRLPDHRHVQQIIANAIIATLAPASYISYNIVGIVTCFAMLPLALTQSKEPELPEITRYETFFNYRVSPLAAFGVIVARLSTATVGSVEPIFAIAVGLDLSQIAPFLIVSVIGGMISQFSAGILADRMSRHSVLLVYSIMASALCLAMMLPIMELRVIGMPLVYVMSFLSGLTIYPINSTCAAHASDFVESDRMISLSA